MRGILKLFAKSPFGLLVKHTSQVSETVDLLRPLFEAFLSGDRSRLQEIYEQICVKEHEADRIKNEVRDRLPRSVLLPVNRGDILSYVKEQDGIADAVEDIGVILTMRRLKMVPELEPRLMELVDKVHDAAELLFAAAREMTNLAAASFAGPEVNRVLGMITEIHGLEATADRLQAEFSKQVFEAEPEVDPVSVYQWMKIVEVLGDVADRAENTGDILRLMLASS